MDLQTRWSVEKEHHEQEAVAWVSQVDPKYLVQPDGYRLIRFHHYPDVEKMFSDFLGDLRRKNVLELGCGRGDLSVMLAQLGAIVKATDIAEGYVQIVQKRAILNNVEGNLQCSQMPGEALQYENGSFDCVCGLSILHHLAIDKAWREIHRVLKDGGRAAFVEPLGNSRVLEYLKSQMPFSRIRQGLDTSTEKSMTSRDIQDARTVFTDVSVFEFGLFMRFGRFTQDPRIHDKLAETDRWLLMQMPLMRRYAREALIMVKK